VLRVAVVHSFYGTAQPSGENEVVLAQVEALGAGGVEVAVFAQHTDARQLRRGHAPRAAIEVALGVGPDPTQELARFRPDVVHVHNLFPNYGTRWVGHLPVPVVATLHNYRSLCAKGTLYRDGHLCTECVDHSPVRGLVHACYRGSRAATAPITVAQTHSYPWLPAADRFVVLSGLQRRLLAAGGVPEQAMIEIPNCLPAVLDGGAGDGAGPWLFVGRMDVEKGVQRIMDTWPRDVPLDVVGDGPLRDDVERWAIGRRVRVLGRMPRLAVQEQIRRSRGLVFASRWPEPFGLVYLEALAAGTPVLAAPGTAVADLVEQDGTGTVTDDYARVAQVEEQLPALRAHVRQAFESRYTETVHTEAHLELYRRLQADVRDKEGWPGA
jgi:glycosyltransferase involved in cell wall biosynthesis